MAIQLLVISKIESDREFCRQIAERAQMSLKLILTVSALINALKDKEVKSLVFIDVDDSEFASQHGELSHRKILPLLSARLKPRHIFALADQSLFELPLSSQSDAIGHYLVRNYDDFGTEWMARVCSSLHTVNPFGLDNYKDQDATIQRIDLKASNERVIALEAVSRVLEKRKIHPRALQMMLRCLDELLLNAIFDAPQDWSGKFYRREVARDAIFPFIKREKVTMSMAFNQNFVMVSVLDRFGSFSADRAMGVLKKDYQSDPYLTNVKTKGAGLGLHGIASSGVALMISSRPGIETEAVLAFPYFKSFKETKNCFRSFSFNVRSKPQLVSQ